MFAHSAHEAGLEQYLQPTRFSHWGGDSGRLCYVLLIMFLYVPQSFAQPGASVLRRAR